MGITIHTNDEEHWVQIDITGKLDNRNILDAQKKIQTCPSGSSYSYIINMSETEFIDSCGLSFLLLLREHAGGDDSSVVLKDCKESMKSLLKMSGMQRLMTIV